MINYFLNEINYNSIIVIWLLYPGRGSQVHILASGLLIAQTGIWPDFVLRIWILSSAIVSYHVVQSPRISNEDKRERTWIISHLVGVVHFLSEFCGSFNQPPVSWRLNEKVVPSRENDVDWSAVERGKINVIPL